MSMGASGVIPIRLIDETTGKASDINFAPGRMGDLLYFVCDISRARSELGWAPRVKPAEGVPRLIEWIQENAELFASAETCDSGS